MRTLKNAIVMLLIAAALVLMHSSCSVVSKVFKKEKSKSDSTSTTREVERSEARVDSAAVHESETEGEGTITIEFDSAQSQEPYSRISEYDVLIDDSPIEIVKQAVLYKPIKKITLTGKFKSKDSAAVQLKKDETVDRHKDTDTNVKKEEKVISKEVEKSRTPLILTIGAICLGLLFLILLLRYIYSKLKNTKLMKLLSVFVLATMLASCNGAFGGGLWIVPLIPIALAVMFIYKAYKASKSNSTQQGMHDTRDNTGNVPIWQTGYFKLFVGALLAGIAIIIWIISAR